MYLQICKVLTRMIEQGQLPPRFKMPGSRSLASELGVHRQTVVNAYDELVAQGLIEVKPFRGTFVAEEIPLIKPKALRKSEEVSLAPFPFKRFQYLRKSFLEPKNMLAIDEGLPDLRMSPIDDLRKSYNSLLAREYNRKYLSYDSPAGNSDLRLQISLYLKETRGLKVREDQVLVTRGSQMGLYLASQLVIAQGDRVIVGALNYQTADITLQHAGAQLIRAPVDEFGIDIDFVEQECAKNTVKAIYVTSHHHHPTTATLTVERRMHLLSLAYRHGFVIFEDDYDYDFHYERSPLMPMASADSSGHVVYMGGVSKIIAPGLRIGFLTGPPDFIEGATYLRRIVDRQGDMAMEKVMAQFMASGDFQRHSKKALKIYLQRRNLFVQYLGQFHDYFNFQIPSGGLAIWAGLTKDIPWSVLTHELARRGVSVPNWENYDREKTGHNYNRLGFASMNESEMKTVFETLGESLYHLKPQTS